MGEGAQPGQLPLLPDVPHQQGRERLHRAGDVRVEHVPGEVLGLLPCRRLFQEAVRERARWWGWLDKVPEKRRAASRLQLGEILSVLVTSIVGHKNIDQLRQFFWSMWVSSLLCFVLFIDKRNT